MNLAVIGAGYVGLVTGALFANFGNKVWTVDVDDDKIKSLSSGKIPFYEPGLGELVAKNIASYNLQFTKDYRKAISLSEIIFICVGTPSSKNGKADLSYVYSAAKSVAENLKKPAIVVIKSTVPPGVNLKIERWMKKFTKISFDLASVPEFLREGKAVTDTLNPHRVVIGSEKKEVIEKLLKLHEKISGERLVCDPVTAQMIKYASNAFLPTKLTFANAISILCDKFGADTKKVMEGMGMDKRIGSGHLQTGIGYGGSCFPKDIAALIYLAKVSGYNFEMLKAVTQTNKYMIDFFVEKILEVFDGSIKGKVLVVLGLAFGPGTSDMRESVSIPLIKKLKKRGAVIRGCDPQAIFEAKKIFSGVELHEDIYEALKGADGLLLIQDWEEYKNLDFVKIKRIMKSPVIVDCRNIFDRNKMREMGFIYEGIGNF